MEALKGVTLNPTFQGGMKVPKNHTVPQSPHSQGLQPLNSASRGISLGILCSNSPKACQVIAKASEMDIIVVDNDKKLQKVNQMRASGVHGVWDALSERTGIGIRHPKTEFSTQRIFICPGGQKAGKRQRESRGKKQGEGQGICPRGQRTGLPLDTGDRRGQ